MLFRRESLDSAEGKAARLARVPRGDVVWSIKTRGEQKNSPPQPPENRERLAHTFSEGQLRETQQKMRPYKDDGIFFLKFKSPIFSTARTSNLKFNKQ